MTTKIKKNAEWRRLKDHVDTLADGIGYPIDEGIKETVVALMAHGVSTTASCEGHRRRGWAGPWVDIGVLAPQDWGHIKKWLDNKRKITLLRRWSFHEAKKCFKLLKKFYQQHSSSFEDHLILE